MTDVGTSRQDKIKKGRYLDLNLTEKKSVGGNMETTRIIQFWRREEIQEEGKTGRREVSWECSCLILYWFLVWQFIEASTLPSIIPPFLLSSFQHPSLPSFPPFFPSSLPPFLSFLASIISHSLLSLLFSLLSFSSSLSIPFLIPFF